MTVFLTTQYLEEADLLADRIGIIDQGRIVAEGTPDALKAEIGRPSVEVIPVGARGARPHEAGAGRASARPVPPRPRAPAVRLSGGDAQLADVVRALDAEDIRVEHLQLHAPTLDDVFLAKTGRHLEGSGRRRRGRRSPTRRVAA